MSIIDSHTHQIIDSHTHQIIDLIDHHYLLISLDQSKIVCGQLYMSVIGNQLSLIRDTTSIDAIMIDAIQQQYKRILILDLTHPDIQLCELTQIIEEYAALILTKELCVFSYQRKPYAYLIDQNVYHWFLCESYESIRPFAQLINLFISTYPSHQVFNHTDVCNNQLDIFDLNESQVFNVSPLDHSQTHL